MDLIERIFQEKVFFILHVIIGMLFSPLMQLNIIKIYGVMALLKLSFLLLGIWMTY